MIGNILILTPIIRIFGLLLMFKVTVRLTKYFRKKFSNENLDHLIHIYGKGSYAVITGGTSGIGFEFTKQLATLGFNIVNISRNPQKLKDRAIELKQLTKKTNKNFKIINIVKDFTKSNKTEFYKEISEELEGLDISILVNNVGIATEADLTMDKIAYKNLSGMVTANCNSQVGMLKTLLPNLIKRSKSSKKLRSGVIDLSSQSSCTPCPGIATYASTKVFNRFLTLGLSGYLNDHVDFLSVQPSYVETNMTKAFKAQLPGIIMVDECVRGSLSCLGKFRMTCGGKGHTFTWSYAEFVRWGFPEEYSVGVKKFFRKIKLVN